jgi:hypothetical protein
LLLDPRHNPVLVAHLLVDVQPLVAQLEYDVQKKLGLGHVL